MRKFMFVLVAMLLALSAKATEFGFITLEVKSGSTVGEVFFAHPEVQNLGFTVYSKEYKEAWESINGPTDFSRLKPGMYKFPVTKIIEQEAQAVGIPTSLPASETEEFIPETREYKPSGLVDFDTKKYTEVTQEDLSPAPAQQSTETLEQKIASEATIQIATEAKLEQPLEILIADQKPEAFSMKAEDKIEEQNKSVNTRIKKRNYPKESILWAKLPHLIFGSTLLATLILGVVFIKRHLPTLVSWRKKILQKLVHIDLGKQKSPTPSPREAELEAKINQLEKELAEYRFTFAYPGLRRRSDQQLLRSIKLQVKEKTKEGTPLVFVPGLDELVPARPLIVESALRRAQEILGDKCLYIMPEREASPAKETKKPATRPKLRILKKQPAKVAASQ